jgi:hypothetical protein
MLWRGPGVSTECVSFSRLRMASNSLLGAVSESKVAGETRGYAEAYFYLEYL